MKNFIIGLIVGIVIGGITIVWAAPGFIVDSTGTGFGTTANPIFIEGV